MKTPLEISRRLCIAILLACLPTSPCAHAEDATLTPSTLHAPLVVIGASASAGFTLSEPFGGAKTPKYRLNRYLAAALLNPNASIQSLAATSFFLEADKQAKQQIEGALATKPAAVIGIDFLFWFCYGNVPNEEDRAPRFDRGLAYLDQLNCPLVIGDIPDASGAVGGILGAKEVPKPEVIAAANRRLTEWASRRKNVALVSLSEFMTACLNDHALSIGPLTIPEGQTGKLLQSDKLHPARHGCAALALAILNALTREPGLITSKDVRWDIEDVYLRAQETPGASSTSNAPAAAAP